jgi:hypothetical protein
MSTTEPLRPIITHDDDDNALPYAEACRRTAQLYREEAEMLDRDDPRRDEVTTRAETFQEEADRVDPLTVARVFIRPLDGDGAPTAEGWTELEGITGVTGLDMGTAAPVTDEMVTAAMDSLNTTVDVELSDADAKELSTMEVEEPERIPNRLVYASDVVPGMILVTERQCSHARGLMATLVGTHSHGYALSTVLEIRQGEGAMAHLLSAIVLDEAGEQQPCLWHTVELVRIRVDG